MNSNRVYTFAEWEQGFRRAFAAAVPLENLPTQARGPLLASDNDEPEPAPAPAPFNPSAKADAARQRQYENAMRLDQQIRPYPWGER